jgi:hypothetical protein
MMKDGGTPGCEIGSSIEVSEDLDQRCHESSPPSLVTGADAGPVVAVKIFVEEQVITPVRVALEFLRAAKHWPMAGRIAQKDPGQSVSDLARDLEQIHGAARAVGQSILKASP